MSDNARLLPSNGMAATNSSSSSSSSPTTISATAYASSRPPSSSVCNLKNVRTFLGTLVFFTLGFVFVMSFIQASGHIAWKNHLASNPVWDPLKAVRELAERAKAVLTVGNQTETRTSKNLPISPNPAAASPVMLENGGGRDFTNQDEEVTEGFREFVRKKTGGRSTVAQYLASVRAYLSNFRSPVIRENSDVHSWPDTKAETAARGAKGLNSTKQIMFFNAPTFFSRNKDWFQICPLKDCQILWTYKKDKLKDADAVVYQGSPASDVVTPRGHPRQVYVFFTMESPLYTGNAYRTKPWNSAFNWTWNFRRDSDIFEPVGYLRRNPSPPSLKDLLAIIRNKQKKVAWISSNCKAPSKRDQYVKKMLKVIHVDHYGDCGTLRCPRQQSACDTMLTQYFFYLSFENALCDDYVTEKAYKTFGEGVHVIPVVRGGANYSHLFPEGSYVDANAFKTPEDLSRHLQELSADEPRYLDMLWRKAHFQYLEHGLLDSFCQLCYKLHHLDRFAKTYPDLYAWYDRKQCQHSAAR